MASVSEDPKPTGTPTQEAKQDNGGNAGKTNLIINYLPQCLTDDEFNSIFSHIGPIKASKIVRHSATGRSYGFGFVDYQDPGAAACAIETLNGLQMLDKTIKVSYARPGGERIKGAKLYIRGIPKDYSLEQAEKIFADFGELIEFRVTEGKSRRDRRLAFVLYDLRDNAEAAMMALTGTTLPGATRPLVIKYAKPNSNKRKGHRGRGARRQRTETPNAATGGVSNLQFLAWNRYKPLQDPNLYMAHMTPGTSVTGEEGLHIYNIGTDTDEISLWRFLANYGKVTNVSIVRDTATGQSTGYGIASTASFQDWVSVIEALNLVPLC